MPRLRRPVEDSMCDTQSIAQITIFSGSTAPDQTPEHDCFFPSTWDQKLPPLASVGPEVWSRFARVDPFVLKFV